MLILSAGLIATALAGCAAPEEAVDGNDTIDDGIGTGVTTQAVIIDDRVYQCDDLLDNDGICEEYELDEDATATGDMESYTSANGGVMIDGRAYECDDIDNVDIDVNDTNDNGLGDDVDMSGDSVGECELYEIVDEV